MQMALAPHSHDVAPPQLARLLGWLTTGRGGGPVAAGSGGLPAWLPELAASCEPLEDAADGAVQPRCLQIDLTAYFQTVSGLKSCAA